jgi:hypothetical protein
MTAEPSDPVGVGDPLAQLERTFIDEFLRARGVDPHTVHELPEAQARSLLKGASIYAATKLTEVEARAHFIHEIHDGRTPR